MMDGATIRAMSQQAARKAAKAHKLPYVVWPHDLDGWKAQVANGQLPELPFPFLGEYVPKGWEMVEEYFVDSSGWGKAGEPALTIPQFVDKIKPDCGYAITEAGQFQVYIGEFRKV